MIRSSWWTPLSCLHWISEDVINNIVTSMSYRPQLNNANTHICVLHMLDLFDKYAMTWCDHQYITRNMMNKVKRDCTPNRYAVNELNHACSTTAIQKYVFGLDICNKRYWSCDAGETLIESPKRVNTALSDAALFETSTVLNVGVP